MKKKNVLNLIKYYIENNDESFRNEAYEIAKDFLNGGIITLDGDLGAGKTAFVRGFVKGLGITDNVVSPTFTIVNEYLHGDIPVFHFDVYRIGSVDEMYDLGWEYYLSRGGVVLVEWAINVKELFENEDYTEITITKNLDISEDFRLITLRRNA